jgi:hypothetical protein
MFRVITKRFFQKKLTAEFTGIDNALTFAKVIALMMQMLDKKSPTISR